MQFLQPPPLYSSGDKSKKIMTNPVDAYPYTGGIIGNDAEDHLEYEPAAEALAEMKLTPYTGLDSEPLIRYLYTGREYNIETGDYYYRARIYDQSVGRFGGKDPVKSPNLYYYSNGNPLMFIDNSGCRTELPTHFPLPWNIYFGPGATYNPEQFIVLFGNYILFPALISYITGSSVWVLYPNNASADNPNYMADINQCDKQNHGCNKCCKNWADLHSSIDETKCHQACAEETKKCKNEVDNKYGDSRETNTADTGKMWDDVKVNCWGE